MRFDALSFQSNYDRLYNYWPEIYARPLSSLSKFDYATYFLIIRCLLRRAYYAPFTRRQNACVCFDFIARLLSLVHRLILLPQAPCTLQLWHHFYIALKVYIYYYAHESILFIYICRLLSLSLYAATNTKKIFDYYIR